MITVEEARKIIQDNTLNLGIEEIDLDKSIGRIIREDVIADRDFPPYDRVTMDGIAIRYDAFDKGNKEFKIADIAAAGDPQKSLRESGKCLEVMTGAIMPDGLDTVIPYEMISIQNGVAKIETENIKLRQNIHFRGSDRKKSDLIIRQGKQLTSPEIGVCATVGKARLKVSRLPKTIIISSGDELVEIDEQPEKHQIRKSNVHRLKTALQNLGIPVITDHINDDLEEIKRHLSGHLKEFDLIMLSGGVSKGKYDFIPQALDELGVKKLFHRVAQRPGKPFWFGRKENTCVFAFPGNPVSSFMCMQTYFEPWLYKSLNSEETQKPIAVLNADVEFKPDLTYFLEVRIAYSNKGQILAEPLKGNGSGDLANLADADAFIELPKGKNIYKKGEVYPIIPFR